MIENRKKTNIFESWAEYQMRNVHLFCHAFALGCLFLGSLRVPSVLKYIK